MRNSPLIGNQVFPRISAEEIINEYGIDWVGHYFTHKEFGEVCVCHCGLTESGLALGKKDPDDKFTVQVVAVVTLKEEMQ